MTDQPGIYTMHIEKPSGHVIQHGFHLGTDRAVALGFVMERLASDRAIVSVALRRDGKLDRIFDHDDL